MKIKTLLYWITLYRPVIDIVVGAVKGVYQAIQTIKSDDNYQKQKEAFEKANEIPLESEEK